MHIARIIHVKNYIHHGAPKILNLLLTLKVVIIGTLTSSGGGEGGLLLWIGFLLRDSQKEL